MLTLLVVTLLVLANLAFAARSLEIALRSNFVLERADAPSDAPWLSIIVPARNEARGIEACVRSLLGQEYPQFEVIVVDDRSEDDTAAIVARIALEDRGLTLVAGEPLPTGWVGKPWALHQGARRARGAWLLFTDADTIHEPSAASAAFVYARARRLDVLSILTEQIMRTPAERIFLPTILWTIAFAIGSLADMNDPARENALFNGQYVLARREAYEGIGGHESVRGEIAEDLELARRFKQDGRYKTALVGGNDLVRVRMYRSFTELWNGFVKNFALGARGRPLAAALGITYLACIGPFTPIALLCAVLSGAWLAAAVLAFAMLAAILGASLGMGRLGLGAGSAWWIPIAMALVVAIFLTSVVRHARGGVEWRGRRYA